MPAFQASADLHRRSICRRPAIWATALGAALAAGPAWPQTGETTGPLQPGEAYVTRFSGTTEVARGGARIDVNGVVGSIIDVRSPQQPPQGQHWIDEPQRAPVRAGEVGQVFGVALDEAAQPNIYLAATSAFGLHLDPGGRGWMEGMWGQGGGPGTIYRLDAREGYRPRVFADVRLRGRQNTGAALGNIAFDPFNRQLLVSDLETGMIHRIRVSDGADLGTFDHGTEGRPSFLDAMSGQTKSLPPIAFNPASRARLEDCPGGRFERQTECWNFAASGRRVWGIGVGQDPLRGAVRAYYAVWSGPAFGNTDWNRAGEDDKRNAIWSVRLTAEGAFDRSDVRREFELPDFFVAPNDIARAGYSQPVSDISFSRCGERPVMLLAERGGIRNLGLAAENAFSYPHEARALRYELDRNGTWRPVGRYDVGFYDRKKEGQPFIRANCSGGITFAPGYDPQTWVVDLARKDEFVWMSGHALCSPDAPCVLPDYASSAAAGGGESPQPAAGQGSGGEASPDDSQVHGIQGLAETAFEEVAPAAAFAPHPQNTDSYPPNGPLQAYLIDTDENVDEAGGLIEQELTRNDATRIGDIAIYQPCPAPRPAVRASPSYLLPPPVPGVEPPPLVGHPQDFSHAQISSHGAISSHNRFGSHNPFWSHSRWGSHNTFWSHSRDGSHSVFWSHNRYGSHGRRESHDRFASHSIAFSHFRLGSHAARFSHSRAGSHVPLLSHSFTASHSRVISHTRLGSHNLALSHSRLSSHTTALSHSLKGSHNLAVSHSRMKSHSTIISSGPGHTVFLSKGHNPVISKGPLHTVIQSKGPGHTLVLSKGHNPVISKGTVHTVIQSKGPGHTLVLSKGHNPVVSKGTVHTVIQSKGPPGHSYILSKGVSHSTALSQAGHTLAQSKGHSTALSKGTTHSVLLSKGPVHSPAASSAVKKLPPVKEPAIKLIEPKKVPSKLPPPSTKVLKTPTVKTLPKSTPKVQVQKKPQVKTIQPALPKQIQQKPAVKKIEKKGPPP